MGGQHSLPSLLARDISAPRFDDYLDALGAFPETVPLAADGSAELSALPSEAIRTRSWGEARVSTRSIAPEHVTGLRRAVPAMLRVAWEVEEPWFTYTHESMETLEHNGIKKLAGFMDVVWRNDERRHANLLKAAYLRVTGEEDMTAVPHAWTAETYGEAALLRHLYMRLVAELGAGTTYSVLASHTRHELHATMMNLAGDEYRHLAVFWAACKWWMGDALLRRVAGTVKTVTALGLFHRKERSGMLRPGIQEATLLAEMGAAMSLVVARMLPWDRTLSRSRLESVFGSREACAARAVAKPAAAMC